MTRTRDLLITSEMHYRLCYTSIISLAIISVLKRKVNSFLYWGEIGLHEAENNGIIIYNEAYEVR